MEIEDVLEENNREFIFGCLKYLKEHNLCTEEVLALLANTEQCKEKFNCKEEILLEIYPKDIADPSRLRSLRYDGSGKSRFYKDIFSIGSRMFLVTNYWYGSLSEQKSTVKDNRTPFYEWISRLQEKAN